MRVLHICSDFAKQSIYNQLVSHLAENNDLQQYVYVPTRTHEEIGKYQNLNLSNVNYFYKHILNKFDRIFYHNKISKTTKYITSELSGNSIDIIHAHFLFSDGGIALNYFKKFKTPYVVAVRNTDLNLFFKYMIHLRAKGIEILTHASKVIFLSHAYQEELFNKYIPESLKKLIAEKSEVIPNGVDSFWLENIYTERVLNSEIIKVLYVGDFSKNKNIQSTISAIQLLREEGKDIRYTVVGGGGDYESEILSLIKLHQNWITYIPTTHNKVELLEIFRENDIFCMPSKYETFGLVYIEALSQSLPIIYTKGQGVDGYFKVGEVGFAVNCMDILDIKEKIGAVLTNFSNISPNCYKFASDFSWKKITNQYNNIYTSIVK